MLGLNRLLTSIIVLLCVFDFCLANIPKEPAADASKPPSNTPELLPDWLCEDYSLSETAHFLVAHDAGMQQGQTLTNRLEFAFQRFQDCFRSSGFELKPLQSKLAWISFTDPGQYKNYILRAEKMDVSRLTGYYSARTNRVVMMESAPLESSDSKAISQLPTDISAITDADPNQLVKIAHELAHQLAFNTGLQKRGVMYPLWVSEGLATQYETRLSYCYSTNRARNQRLQQMHAERRLIPVDEFICLTRLAADRLRCEELYAQAWGFFGFLVEHYPAQLKNYLESLYSVKKGFRTPEVLSQEFADHFPSINQLDAEWFQYLADLPTL